MADIESNLEKVELIIDYNKFAQPGDILYLQKLLSHFESSDCPIEDAARAIGEDVERFKAIMAGKKSLGKTAKLAILAIDNGISPIVREN